MGARHIAVWLAALALPVPAFAAGGAHTIDDAEVETPGHCHLEYWGVRLSGNTGIFNLGPACTPAKLPNLEIGAYVLHSYPGKVTDFNFGPSLKWELRSPDRRLGIAIDAVAAYSTRTKRIESGGLIVPLTLDVTKWLRLNGNVGYLWTHTNNLHSAFVGGQAMIQLTPRLSLMGETYVRRPGGTVGVQSGVRWTPRDWIDIDLLGARKVDGTTPNAFTLGITLRH